MEQADILQINNLIEFLKNNPCNNELQGAIEVLEELLLKLQERKSAAISKKGEMQKAFEITSDIKCICKVLELLERALDTDDNQQLINLAIKTLENTIA